jgi:hypothetical protein
VTATTTAAPPAFIPPTHVWVPDGRRGSFGPEVVGFAESLGHSVDPEQAADIDTLTSYGRGGTYLTLETAYVEARQQGKTDRVGLPIALADVFLFHAEVTWSAHRVETVLGVMNTMLTLIRANASLSRRVKRIVEQRSEWAIELTTGGLIEFRVRGGGGGRGLPRDIWVIDEALFVDSTDMGDRLPTLSSRPNPQVRYYSSACKVASTQLRQVMRRGRLRNDPSLIWVERCAPGSWAKPGCQLPQCDHTLGSVGCTLDDETRWHYANHRIGRRPGPSYQFIRSERRALPPLEFGRERLGWHEDGPDGARHPLRSDDWAAAAVEVSPDQDGTPAFFITVGLDGGACIGVAYRGPDGLPHVELADRRPGVEWLQGDRGRLADLKRAWPAARFAAGKAGPVAGMAGLPVDVELWSSAEMAQACVLHERLNRERAYTHSDDPDVDTSLRGAVSKLAGDGMWTWDWKASTGLAPVAAETGALGLLLARPVILPAIY